MPYESKAQQGLFHSPNSPVSKTEVAKWDRESKGQKNLPQYAAKKPRGAKALFKRKKPSASSA